MQTTIINFANVGSQIPKAIEPKGLNTSTFGSVFSNMTKITDETIASIDNTNSLVGMEELLSFLSLNHLTEIDGAGAFIEDWMINGAELGSHSFIQKILNDEYWHSISDLLGSIQMEVNVNSEKLPTLGEGSFFEVSFKALKGITELFNNSGGLTNLKDNLPIIKLVKLQTLLANFIDLSDKELNKNNSVKSLLNEIASKLEKQMSIQTTGSLVKQVEQTNTLVEARLSNTNQINTVIEKPTLNSKDTLISIYQRNIKNDSLETISVGKKSYSSATNDQPLGQSFTPLMSKVEQLVLTVGKNDAPVNQEQFIKSFESIIAKSIFQNGKGLQKILIKLNPDHLGSIRIELIQKDNMMVAKILASSGKAKELLDSHLSGLKQAFTNQNLSVERIEVSQSINPFNQEKSLTREHGQNQQQPRQQENTTQEQDENEVDFLTSFEEALLSVEG
ncbi:flagellar hook-length control protein FliK [Peribacillus acanthi]|uniref:flagellar hook-length control protein FliK n=1 Tax=Peribacillus acanthi TaxID=2171554 RepID=UPI000D3ECF18|nr:flagellar hook-length control protein FliK [Peribacillus acanthi]